MKKDILLFFIPIYGLANILNRLRLDTIILAVACIIYNWGLAVFIAILYTK